MNQRSASPQRKLSVHLLPSLAPQHTPADAALVIDVLRATTTATTLLEARAQAVIFAPSIESTREIREGLRRQGSAALLAGERGGLKIEGFDLGNSPLEARQARGKVAIMNTTNGTGAAHIAAKSADQVVLACLRNASAAAKAVAAAHSVAVYCAGTDGQVSLDDCYAAAAVVRALTQQQGGSLQAWALNDSAHMVLGLLELFPTPEAALRASHHGQRLLRLGLEADLQFCAQLDLSAAVPQLVGQDLAGKGAGGLKFALI